VLLEFALAFSVIALSVAGLGIGLLFGRGAPRGSCATAMSADDGLCSVCGRSATLEEDKP
jgi:hypothetical protein